MENNKQEAMYPAGVMTNTEIPFTRKEYPVEISLDAVRADIEFLLLRKHKQYHNSDFCLMEVSSDGTFVYNFTDEVGRLTSFKAKWSREYGYTTIDFTGQSVYEVNALYPSNTVEEEPVVNREHFQPTAEEVENAVRWAEGLAEAEKVKHVKLPRNFAEDEEPLLPPEAREFIRKEVDTGGCDESPLLPNTEL